jgi:hypothetical protein
MSFPFLETAELTRLSEPRCGHDDQGRELTATMETAFGGFKGHVFTLEILRHAL